MLQSVAQSVEGPFNEPSKLHAFLTLENISKLNGVVLSPISPYSHIRPKESAILIIRVFSKIKFELTECFKMAARSFIGSSYELFFFSGLLNLKFCQQPFTNVLFCWKVGIIRNEI